MKIKLPRKSEGRGRKVGDHHPIKSKARRRGLVEGMVGFNGNKVHPYGRAGNPKYNIRKRLELIEKKRAQLEMHELQALARENASAVMQALIDISLDKRAMASSRIAAGAVVLDRGYGKATQVSMSANLTNGKANEITGDELDKRIGKALERVENLTRRTTKAPESQNRSGDLRKLN